VLASPVASCKSSSMPAQPSEPTGQEPSPGEHPEARGFGSRRSWRWELPLLLGLCVALPLAVLASARSLAEAAAGYLPPELDDKLGRPSWELLQLTAHRCEDPATERYLSTILDPLIAALGPVPFEFRVMVVNTPEVNAFALPGGYLVVNSGLLSRAKTGEEVAAVLAHELSHVTARHSTKRLVGGLGAGAALGVLFGIVDVSAPAYPLAQLAGLRYERRQESEADELGQALLMRAGISPLGMATFFERLRDSPQPPEVLSTHPDPGDRAERARRAASGFQARVELPPPTGLGCVEAEK
jgi:predicted Zn-dependent protease